MRTTLLCFSLLFALSASGFEMLVKARSVAHPDATEDRVGRLKLGMIAVIRPDGWKWGTKETLPRYVIIKVPMASPAVAYKYTGEQLDGDGNLYRARRWQIRWADLPQAAKDKLATGVLTIKATAAYTGAYDYTWAQIKSFFRNLETGLDETADL